MTTWTMRVAIAMVVLAPAARADDTAKTKAVFVSNDTAKWIPAPPDFPKGAQMAILYGDPTKPGELALRLKLPDGYKVAPHWHDRTEQLTMISGTVLLTMGDTMGGESHTMKAGDYHALPPKARHGAIAKGEAIIQVNYQGPFEIHYVNPADNPNPKSARR